MASGFGPLDLRMGAAFDADRSAMLAAALREAAATIAVMPANFIRYPNSADRVFAASPSTPRLMGGLALDAETLDAFGNIAVSGHVWRAMQLLSDKASARGPLLRNEPVSAFG
ncbi:MULTISPECIES: hypothetical protein [unclassified Sphingomonas]|uniref:hypothetical protein n=1 Tax=unclassified Sphingomonas TaxID=196159 RepID=UPI0006F243C0|nr:MULTISPECIES: hypothetical protein [unclassified Sphingomonas]KQN11668.1 hypothetical protein ASE79_06265 [Sphingomonas sp. Leaf28]MBD8736818.1 hypothetical protein [Sphingomonas sp. CFBP 13706]